MPKMPSSIPTANSVQPTAAGIPQTPLHDADQRLTESQGVLENEEDPRIPDDAPAALSNLPVEAQVREADLDPRPRGGDRPQARELTATETAANRPGMSGAKA